MFELRSAFWCQTVLGPHAHLGRDRVHSNRSDHNDKYEMDQFTTMLGVVATEDDDVLDVVVEAGDDC